ncbi:FecR family protein [Chitinophaga eiseniae]|uniref:DUF4974 domain-containing protein n=1 Tax=Chitinophaga eiseniae TaxID=634771 RepID=A0A847SJ07_9BACT|nr:FecR family protein [Chitinophaga eiseniae]NLR77119.1 DUF4974 domain-containing protein [Chitinophaga eiseniae]
MKKQAVIVLARKYDAGTITEQERLSWEKWCNSASLEAFNEMLREAFPGRTFSEGQLLYHRKQAIESLLDDAERREGGREVAFGRRYWAAAAAAVILVAGATWLYHKTKQPGIDNFRVAAKIQPGRQGAMLTLANGQQVLLDSLGNGILTAQQGTNLLMDSGKLKYDVLKNESGNIATNTITTPKARQFTMVLPDGSVLWLNSSSSVKFPVSFAGSERRIEASGEIYIEVAQRANHPFFVSLPDRTTIEVLGTSFNVSAYSDDKNITTTLLTGAINVTTASEKISLKPGQQALTGENGSKMAINTSPDLTKVMAWKNRLFNFEGSNIKDVMKQLSRWYDIDVIYEGTPPDIDFGGKLSMDISLDGVLHALKDAEVHFRMDGRQLTILP